MDPIKLPSLNLEDLTGDDAPHVILPKLGRRDVILDRPYAEELELNEMLQRSGDLELVGDDTPTEERIKRQRQALEAQRKAVRAILGLTAEELEQVRLGHLPAVCVFYSNILKEQVRAAAADPTEAE